MSFTIRYNRTSNHIEGLDITSQDSADGLDYAMSACSALSRGLTRFAKGPTFETPAEALAHAKLLRQRKMCAKCEAAALKMIEG